ncbi:hypothetical protein [Pseudonocardia acaciae]|uniref:hypothetical protein n=1 Tax=Pseudonocardia acaciae TaxID=551276 RepID=UPI0006866DE9|nr:hypothetical protein [Pseudonocardia acaciae]
MKALLARRGTAGTSVPAAAGAGRSDQIRVATWAAAVAAGLGLVGVVLFGALWWNATSGTTSETATTREDALAAARQIAVNLQTLDYRTVDKGLDTWASSVTGPMLDELTKNRQQYADKVRTAQTTTTAKLVDAALSDLDVAGGKASAVAAVDVSTVRTVNGAPSPPETKQVRVKIDLVRTPDAGWKASAASPIRS